MQIFLWPESTESKWSGEILMLSLWGERCNKTPQYKTGYMESKLRFGFKHQLETTQNQHACWPKNGTFAPIWLLGGVRNDEPHLTIVHILF